MLFLYQDGKKHNEGQQQQEIEIDPNWDSAKITTQKSNVNKWTFISVDYIHKTDK